MIWRLLTGRLTRASLLTFLIVVAARGVYLINKQDALELQRFVQVWIGTPEPTQVRLHTLITPAPADIATSAAPLDGHIYIQLSDDLLRELGALTDEIDQLLVPLTEQQGVTTTQFNETTKQIAMRFTRFGAVSTQIRRLHPPNTHIDYHRQVLEVLSHMEQISQASILDYDNPGLISNETASKLLLDLEQSIDQMIELRRSLPD